MTPLFKLLARVTTALTLVAALGVVMPATASPSVNAAAPAALGKPTGDDGGGRDCVVGKVSENSLVSRYCEYQRRAKGGKIDLSVSWNYQTKGRSQPKQRTGLATGKIKDVRGNNKCFYLRTEFTLTGQVRLDSVCNKGAVKGVDIPLNPAEATKGVLKIFMCSSTAADSCKRVWRQFVGKEVDPDKYPVL